MGVLTKLESDYSINVNSMLKTHFIKTQFFRKNKCGNSPGSNHKK